MPSPLQPFLEPSRPQPASETLTWLFTPAGQLLLASPSAQQLSLLSDPYAIIVPNWLQQVVERALATDRPSLEQAPQVENLRVALVTEVVHIPLTLELQWLADTDSGSTLLLVTGSCQDLNQSLLSDWQQLQFLEAQRLSHKVSYWSWNREQANQFFAAPQVYVLLGQDSNQPLTLETFLQSCRGSLDDLQSAATSLGNQRSHWIGDFQVHTAQGDRWLECHCLLHHDSEGQLISIVGNLKDITEEHHILSLIQDSEARFQAVLENNPNGILILDEQGEVLYANSTAEQLFGKSHRELKGKYLGFPLSFNITIHLDLVQSDRSLRHVDVSIVPIPWKQSKAYLALLTDVTNLYQTQQRLQLLQEATEKSPVSIVITNREGSIEYVNQAFESITGYSAQEVIGQNPRILQSGLMPLGFYQNLWATITAGKIWRGEFHNRRKNGELFWERTSISPVKDLAGQIVHFVAVKEDVTEQKRNRELLDHQANYDGLTDLPNRTLALDRLRQAIALSERSNDAVVVMLLDLDRFKNVNDTLGHSYGDRLLQAVAQRLRYSLPREMTISRLGGDEFLIICPSVEEGIHIEKLSQKLLQVISQPIVIEAEELVITASIGVACYPNDGSTPEVLMRNADTAMYSAKRNGGNDFQLFMPTMNAAAHERIQLETHLRHALEQYQLKVFYQPIINLEDGRVVGLEALSRWHDPQLGNITPDRFIPIAEETGLIVPLGYRVIEQACQDVAKWQQQYGQPLWVAVNLSPRQLRSSRFVQTTLKILNRYDFRPDALKLEVTEQMLMDDTASATQMLYTLHEQGIQLALDDFGTGYSALSYLRRYPFQSLKVDKSFLSDLPDSAESCALVKTIVAMAHGLGMQAIAEGVETEEHVQFLKEIGCEYAQGFFFSRPLPAAEIEPFLAQSIGSIS
ncbi:sensor domain-containing protein [Synechococcus elongatus]|uniref:EAL domain-containing protein n=1 Tax=Synechococcus elongatus PCC 11802 TaxID=2283154 RepID=A0AAU6R4E6_SYNEL|nr:EAL domain-containing protein [Synechococcus elongatus]QFZ92228.1 EAL domain-containing protein [Synechococcus elongatus PCC 11802]